MKRVFITLCISLLIDSYSLHAQIANSVDKWMEYIDELAAETDDEEKIQTLYADLSYLTEHPFELNLATEEELKRLPFLSDRQIGNLLSYRARYGKMATLYELKNVESLDTQTIALLLPFVYIGDRTVEKRPFTVNNLLNYGSNELQIRYDQCFQQKKGYRSYPDSTLQQYPNRKYMGEPFYTSLRYSYAFDERLQLGLVAEKDAGEPFWNGYHKGYDYYSAHLFLKDVNKWLKSLAIGDYKISFGQGLVISNDFSPSRSAVVTQAERRNNGFRRHFSTNESDYFRGAAATVVWDKFEFSLFYSYRTPDAGVDSNAVRSIKTDGIHRVPDDKDKKHAITMQTYGGNIRYATPNFCIGLTALSYSFGSFDMQPEAKPYNLYYFRGKTNLNAGVDYMLKNKRIKLYGETAISANGALSTLNGLQLTPVSYLSVLALHRYYDRRYQAYFGNAFSQGSSVQNEQGLYLGMQVVPMAYWKVSAYADFFTYPWLKYGVDAPSSGKEYMAQVDYTRGENVSTYVRYTYRQKEKNIQLPEAVSLSIFPYAQHRLRLQASYRVAEALTMRMSADGVLYNEGVGGQASRGIMLAQSWGWRPTTLPFQGDVYAAWFCTDDYSSRISSYEKNILYAFTMPSFYGKGVRLSTTFRWDIVDKLSLSAKLAYTHYTDRDVIGTELEAIEGKNKTDLYVLLRWKFG